MIKSPDCILDAPSAWIGLLSILAPTESRAAFILHSRSFGWIFRSGLTESGTLIMTLADLNSLIARFEGGFAGLGSGSIEEEEGLTALAQDLTGFDSRGC